MASTESLKGLERMLASNKPDVIFLVDFPSDNHFPPTNLHYITRIYARAEKAGQVALHISGLEKDGEIQNDLKLPSSSLEGFKIYMEQVRKRNDAVKAAIMHDPEAKPEDIDLNGIDAEVMHFLQTHGNTIGTCYLNSSNPKEQLASPALEDYVEIGAMVKQFKGEQREEQTLFIKPEQYDGLQSYEDYKAESYKKQVEIANKTGGLSVLGKDAISITRRRMVFERIKSMPTYQKVLLGAGALGYATWAVSQLINNK